MKPKLWLILAIVILFVSLLSSCGEPPLAPFEGIWGTDNVFVTSVGGNADVRITLTDGYLEALFYVPPGTATLHDNSARGTYIERDHVFTIIITENHSGGTWTSLPIEEEHRALYDLYEGSLSLFLDNDLDGAYDDFWNLDPL